MAETLLKQILTEFKQYNLEFLYKMIEDMNISEMLTDSRVIEAMRNIRIEDFITMDMIDTFIPADIKRENKIDDTLLKSILLQLFASFYSNRPLPFYNHPIYGRSTSAPHMIAIMAQLIEVEPNDTVLILGSKSGYLESIIQDMDQNIRLYIIEKVPQIYEITKYNINRIHAEEKIKIYCMDPILDVEKLPIKDFDKIFITGYMNYLPETLINHVKIGGLICAPIGDSYQQDLIRFFKTGSECYDEEQFMGVIFSPLITDFEFKVKN